MPKIKKIITNEEGFRPVLVDFQNGKIKASEGDNVKSSLYKNGNGKTIVGVTNGNMLYTGEIDNQNDLYHNFLLVHNKNTGKYNTVIVRFKSIFAASEIGGYAKFYESLTWFQNRKYLPKDVRLIQVDCCTVSPLLDNKTNTMDVSIAPTVSSVSELSKQFGSKKSKRSIEQQERLKMNIETVKEQLEKTVSDIKLDETDASFTTSSENDSLYRPNINRDASTIDQVYKIDDVVPQNVLDTLYNEAELIVDGADLNEYNLTSFASDSISQILTSSSSNQAKIHRVTVFLYINYLIKFMNTPVKNITKKFVVCDKSSEVNAQILNNYSVNTGHNRTRPLSMKDKALCSILVLAALAGDYEVNIETLSKHFKIGIKKVMEISRVLAFSSSKNKAVVTLKLPLPDPVALSSKRKRKSL